MHTVVWTVFLRKIIHSKCHLTIVMFIRLEGFDIIVRVAIMSIFSNDKILLSVVIVFEMIKFLNLKCVCES